MLNLAEGELVQGILLEEGIPSILRRSGGFDVPDMIAAGPRDVMVPASAVEVARALLAAEVPEIEDAEDEGGPGSAAGEANPDAGEGRDDRSRLAFRVAAAILALLLLFAAVTGALYAVLY